MLYRRAVPMLWLASLFLELWPAGFVPPFSHNPYYLIRGFQIPLQLVV
jgi:hypothetical protein